MRPSPPPSAKPRILALSVVLGLAFAGLGVRVTWIQAVESPSLRRLARGQQLQQVEIPTRRGRLLDRHGRELAINLGADSAYAVPRLIRDPDAFARQVAPIVGLSVAEVRSRLDPERYFAWLGRKLPPEMVARLRALGRGEAIGFEREDRRAYPNDTLAAHVLGFVGIDNQGLAGAELAFDSLLRGAPGRAVVTRDAIGRELADGRRVLRAPSPGHDVVLTVDQVIQHIAERELDAAVARARAAWGTVIILDPRTGEILALAASPSYDPNTATRLPPERWLNRPVTSIYEPGSTFKIVTAAAALETGAVRPDEVFQCPGFLKVPGNHVIRDAHGVKHGTVRLGDILSKSCNVGAAQVGTRVGRAALYDAIRRFGFGSPTGVELPGEGSGIVPEPARWLGPGLQTISIGQGVSVTPLQLVRAFGALANGGVLMQPHIVRTVRDIEGRTVRVYEPRSVGQAMLARTAATLLGMLVATTEDGTGTEAAVDGYRVAGKTGTAQKPSPQGGYAEGKYVASFVGVVPAAQPRLVILVLIDEPQGAIYGGTVAAPVFRSVASQTLWYLRVPPDQVGLRKTVGAGTKRERSPGD